MSSTMLHVLLFALALVDSSDIASVDTVCPVHSSIACQVDEAHAAAARGAYYWSQQKGGPSRTGFSPFQVPTNLSQGPAWSWHEPHHDVIRATPLIDDKFNIYLSTIGGRIFKFNSDGQVLWYHDAHAKVPGVGALYDGKFIIGNGNGEVLALDMDSGSVTWKVRVSPAVSVDCPSVFAFNETILVSTLLPHPHEAALVITGETKVVALNPSNGSVKWMFAPEAPMYNFQAASPGDGTIVFQDQSGGLYRLHLENGHLIWRSGFPERGFRTTAASVVDDGLIFVMSNYVSPQAVKEDGGVLHTYRLSDGQLVYRQEFPGVLYLANQAVAVGKLSADAGPSLIAGIGQNPEWPVFFRYKLHRGWPVWAARFMHRLSLIFPKPFSPAFPAYMIALDAKTGNVQWRYDLDDWVHPATAGDNELAEIRYDDIASGKNPFNSGTCLPDSCSQPVIGGDGTAYFGWEHGIGVAIRDANGDGVIDKDTEVSTYHFGEGFQGSPAMAPGMIAFASCEGLYVFKSGS